MVAVRESPPMMGEDRMESVAGEMLSGVGEM